MIKEIGSAQHVQDAEPLSKKRANATKQMMLYAYQITTVSGIWNCAVLFPLQLALTCLTLQEVPLFHSDIFRDISGSPLFEPYL